MKKSSYISTIRTLFSLLVTVPILLLTAVSNTYAAKNNSGAIPQTKNECLLMKGTLADDVKTGTVMCCIEVDGETNCSVCSDCTLEDVIIFPKTKNPIQSGKVKPAKTKLAEPIKVQQK